MLPQTQLETEFRINEQFDQETEQGEQSKCNL